MTSTSTRLFLDSSLLVLLVVGMVDPGLIAKHKRTKQFPAEAYDLLNEHLLHFDCVLITPNTLTEASNLLGQHREPVRSDLFHMLRNLIERTEEIMVASADASQNSAFPRLGLTDAVLLEVVSAETPLLTTDLKLHFTALERKGEKSAFNFMHLFDY